MYHFGDRFGADADCTGGAKYLGRGCMEHAVNVDALEVTSHQNYQLKKIKNNNEQKIYNWRLKKNCKLAV